VCSPLLPGITAMPRTGSKGASAGTSHLIPKAQLQFQTQRRPPGMPGTLAKAPGWRPELSTRQCRGSAGRTCLSADRHPNFGPRSSGDLSRSQRLRSNHDLSSRCLHIEMDLANAARLVVAPVGFHHSALIVHDAGGAHGAVVHAVLELPTPLSACRTRRGGGARSPSHYGDRKKNGGDLR
jgi:hypothetical protein